MTPTIGRIIHYNDYNNIRPAIIVVIDGQFVDLVVFTDSESGIFFVRNVPEGTAGQHRTWFWPPKVS